MTIGDRIKTAREMRGMSMNELAKKVGVSAPTILKWEHGKYRLTTERVDQLSRALDVGVDYLIGYEPMKDTDAFVANSTHRHKLVDEMINCDVDRLEVFYKLNSLPTDKLEAVVNLLNL